MSGQSKKKPIQSDEAVAQKPEALDYFGGCPHCGLNDGYLNVWNCHWYVCHDHRVKWCIGENLFSSWREQSNELWRENAALLANYTQIEPLHPPESSSHPREELPVVLIDALETILSKYFYEAEDNYKAATIEARRTHIFVSLATVYGWLNGIQHPLKMFEMWMRPWPRERENKCLPQPRPMAGLHLKEKVQ